MSIYGVYGNYQFAFFSPQKPHKFSHNPKFLLRLCEKPIKEGRFIVRAAAAAAASSAPLGGSEQFLGEKPKQKTQRIAGIDQDEIEDPTLIADADSCFCEFNGVKLHHKICDPKLSTPDTLEEQSKSANFPMILLHGFGASVFSWGRVMKPLAQVIHSKVAAFDRPAFGLTSRVEANKSTPLNPYSTMFSVLSTLYFIDFLAAEKAILVGHSAGSLVALDTYFEAPERVAALIFVAPAIFAPFSMRKENRDGINKEIKGNGLGPNTSDNLFSRVSSILSMFTKYIAGAILYMVKGMGGMINALYKRALSAILRSTFGVIVIRMIIDKFGVSAVRSAWYDSKKVSDHVVEGYTKPLKVKGWDKALVEYTVAMLTDSEPKSKPPLAKRLGEISCPVLIVTGDTDRIVPSWNAVRLARAIPGSCLEIIKNCGHLPQEEKPEEFVSIVDNFLVKLFGSAEEPHLQAVT